MTEQALLVFVKNPVAGRVKTRLAATMGNDAAVAIYIQLLKHTVAITEALRMDKYVFYSDQVIREDIWNDEQYHKELQRGNDLGERMKNAFAFIFQKGYQEAIIIGTDCPGLNTDIITDAFINLKRHDVIIGPAEDGGYYLLGMKRLQPGLFENIKWSTDTVLTDTIYCCKTLGLTHYLLQTLHDIDEEKDLYPKYSPGPGNRSPV